MKNKHNTFVVNFLAGPGARKSSLAAGAFSVLKWKNINCELAAEYAKDLVWEHRYKTFENQIYMFGKQHHRIYRLLGEVDVVLTDSPILLTPIYDVEERETLTELVMQEYDKVVNLNFFIKRQSKYNPKGRNQSEAEAIAIDTKVKRFLERNAVPFMEIDGTEESVGKVVEIIEAQLVRSKNESK